MSSKFSRDNRYELLGAKFLFHEFFFLDFQKNTKAKPYSSSRTKIPLAGSKHTDH